MDLFLISFGALFSIMNPLGTVPVFVGLTQENTKRQRALTAFWTAFNVFIILLLSFFAGKYILSFFGISLNALKIAGGLIIASSGFALLTGKFREHKGMKRNKVQKDIHSRDAISLTPLAIPMLAGPGTISLLITFNQEYQSSLQICIILMAMLVTTVSIYLILKSSYFIVKFLGASGINALSRVIGFIVIAIGVEYIISSVVDIIQRIQF
ncbi:MULTISPECIES: MarC family NAAT transporter [unclassified Bizionia]|uniref:MarC family NAAT transporter n=1 Tax=unclassified Bizionia TaxID=2626393 RepID=UPI00205255D0|nr:MarC family NAAT transporter [Bizionia sp. M204]UPS90769.1 MarC family NAAT transporter [Bizionia sp. M204]